LAVLYIAFNQFPAKKGVKTDAFKNRVTLTVCVVIWRSGLYFKDNLLSVIL